MWSSTGTHDDFVDINCIDLTTLNTFRWHNLVLWTISESPMLSYFRNSLELIMVCLWSRMLPLLHMHLKVGLCLERDAREPNAAQASYYQSQVGVLRWMVELGRIDILHDVVLASQTALRREGHLKAMCRMFAYIKVEHNSRMKFDMSVRRMRQSRKERNRSSPLCRF
jgi:hypothetical protein